MEMNEEIRERVRINDELRRCLSVVWREHCVLARDDQKW